MVSGKIKSTISALFCALAIALLSGCEESPKSEQWIGTYLILNHTIEFPIYMDISITKGRVSGRAVDGTMDEATVSGTIEGDAYELLLHPLKHGASTAQDVHFRGIRSDDSIVGEWEHVVGVKGKWTASTTDLPPKEALAPYIPPCDQASRTTIRSSCVNPN